MEDLLSYWKKNEFKLNLEREIKFLVKKTIRQYLKCTMFMFFMLRINGKIKKDP